VPSGRDYGALGAHGRIYVAAIQKDEGLPKFNIYTLVNRVYQVVVRKDFCNSSPQTLRPQSKDIFFSAVPAPLNVLAYLTGVSGKQKLS
jgi:hypothetical protein